MIYNYTLTELGTYLDRSLNRTWVLITKLKKAKKCLEQKCLAKITKFLAKLIA